ncbi:MAG: alpha/beta fold hydrolase [Candidatus Melainabacteria bacterium]|nr:alpha/beta fold hydrolase [Candidatus Melainabacteria bacterium]
MLNQAESEYLHASDGQRLYLRYWYGKPSQPIVIYLHGIEGHSEWFQWTASWLNQQGMSILVPDRRGAGKNFQDRGHLSSYQQLLSDIELTLLSAKGRQPQSPLFLLGNCWGAKAAIITALRASQAVSGLILTSPALKVKVDVSFIDKLQIIMSWLAGSRKGFAIPLVPEMFTDNAHYLDYIKQDSLRLTQATASFFVESMKLTWLANRAARLLAVPVLLVQSGADQIVDKQAVLNWFDRITFPDKTMHVFPEFEHSLDFHAYPQDYLSLLVQWINAHAGARTA